jgi:hypothetical protein
MMSTGSYFKNIATIASSKKIAADAYFKKIATVANLVEDAYLYVEQYARGWLIQTYDHEAKVFWCLSEEGGDEQEFKYSEVDLENDAFYKLTLMEVPE